MVRKVLNCLMVVGLAASAGDFAFAKAALKAKDHCEKAGKPVKGMDQAACEKNQGTWVPAAKASGPSAGSSTTNGASSTTGGAAPSAPKAPGGAK